MERFSFLLSSQFYVNQVRKLYLTGPHLDPKYTRLSSPGATVSVAWVGKGIVYDTGGLSMKTKTTMPGMKADCGGAAGKISGRRLRGLRRGIRN